MSIVDLLGFVIAPAGLLVTGFICGMLFSANGVFRARALALLVWAVVSGALLWIGSMALGPQLANNPLFADFSSVIKSTSYSQILGGVQQTTSAALIGLYEFGTFCGFAAFYSPNKTQLSVDQIAVAGPKPVIRIGNHSVGDSAQGAVSKVEYADPGVLEKDERTLIEVFAFGKAPKAIPRIDNSNPQGYFFEGIPNLNLDTSRISKLLDSLARKGFLESEMSDKMLTCKTCGSANLRLISMCPECKSMRLSRHSILEHFACGLIDKQEAFKKSNGDLVCPKCQGKLHLIGSDYRNLSQMYVCNECNAMNKDLLESMKCAECGTVSPVEEETENYLFSYSLDPSAMERLSDQIKPLEACSSHFRSLGYTVVAPAFVKGRSGTQHTFDLLVVGSDQKVSGPSSIGQIGFQNTVVDIIVSTRPVEVEQVTKVYGKMCDVDCNSLIFAIPALSKSAQNYVEEFKIRVLEGRTLEEALAKPSASPVIA
jgi:translation initiation factor 2 beta subunit (eIF-2beta)/eIF-5